MQSVNSIQPLVFLLLASLDPITAEGPPTRWEKTIRNFEAQDKQNPPPSGAVLFLGSSSIRMWKLKQSFPDTAAINRGFGGSQISDSLQYADRIILPYKPKTIIFYAGDNDVAAGKTPERVLKDFTALTTKVQKALPETIIAFIAIKPSLRRWKLVERMREANSLVSEYCNKHEKLAFVDIDTPMIGADGKPRPELFAKDGLHLSAKGYQLWNSLVAEHLGGVAGKDRN
jgi:lysophospholipase L1-like esterase